MKKYTIFLLIVVVCVNNFFAQKRTMKNPEKDTLVNQLKEVILISNKTQKNIVLGQKSITLSTVDIIKNPINLTNLLRYNSPISFRDYGNGGLSTARFRGTSGSNTAVLWNGIPINAIGSGQTDFNSLSAVTSDEILVNSGGNSVENGSGAIGGEVHLNDILYFKNHKDFQIFSSYGSFNTTSNFFKTTIGTGKWAVKLASTVNYADNDYTYVDARYTDNNGNLLKNENGTYKNYGISLSLGYKFSNKNKLYFYSTKYYGDRLFSDGLPNPAAGSERNEDFNQRYLLKWTSSFSHFSHQLNIAYLTQEYRYYNDKDAVTFDFGSSKNYAINYELKYRFSNYLKISTSLMHDNNAGSTTTILSKIRTFSAFLGNVEYKPTEKLTTAFSIRKEVNSDFKVPIAASLAAEHQMTKNLLLKANISSNYRVPTFNELFWPIVGNLQLIPENSVQGEVGASFKKKNIAISGTFFYIDLNDKILWLPAGFTNLWRPRNVGKVVHKGVEIYLNLSKEMHHHHVNFSSNYTLTVAENIETQTVLPFAPKHVFNFNFEYNYKSITFSVQNLYQSSVFTNDININFYSLNPVYVTNLGSSITILKHKKKKLDVGLNVNNIFNNAYYFSNLRPMPGLNFNMNIHYKF